METRLQLIIRLAGQVELDKPGLVAELRKVMFLAHPKEIGDAACEALELRETIKKLIGQFGCRDR